MLITYAKYSMLKIKPTFSSGTVSLAASWMENGTALLSPLAKGTALLAFLSCKITTTSIFCVMLKHHAKTLC